MDSRFEQQIEFLNQIDQLKHILRKTRLLGGSRHENSAEHSWHLAVMAAILCEYSSEPIDLNKVIRMLLIHDLVEIDAGDTFFFHSEARADAVAKEQAAAKRIFGLLPQDQAIELLALWEEFEAHSSPEARFAKAIDQYAPMLQNAANEGGTWKEFKVDYHTVLDKKKTVREATPRLWEHTLELLDQSHRDGHIEKLEE